MKPERKLVRDTLKNWVAWSRDMERDNAEKGYYSISPPWHLVIPTSRGLKVYDDEAAEMVEEILREMYTRDRNSWLLLRYYYLRDELVVGKEKVVIDKKTMSPVVVGEARKMNDDDFAKWLGISKRWLYMKLGAALDTYGELWLELYWDDCEEKMNA